MEDGALDENPILLDVHMVTSNKFNMLLDHIDNRYVNPVMVITTRLTSHSKKNTDYLLTYLVIVLKLLQQWDCASGEDFALQCLNAIQLSIPAALHLCITQVHHIRNWLKPTLQQVIFTLLKLMTKVELLWIGYEMYQVVAHI